MKEFGYVSVSIKNGIIGKTLHKSLDCLSLRWSDWIKINNKAHADEFKKCKLCFAEENNKKENK